MKTLNKITPPVLTFHPCPEHNLYEFAVRDRRFLLDCNSLALVQLDEGEDEFNAPEAIDLRCKMKPVFKFNYRAQPKYLVLEACHCCTLNCDYCFAMASEPDADMMSYETALRAIGYMFDTKGEQRKDWHVGFFGGEPLMNWKLIEKVVAYVEGRLHPNPTRFHVTTNGILIDEKKARFFGEHNFTLIVSLDGPEHVHDRHRKDRKGEGSFKRVMNALELLRGADLSKKITLRATYTPETAEYVLESIQFLNELRDKGLCNWVSLEPAFLSESQCIDLSRVRESVAKADFELLEREYLKIADWYVARVLGGSTPPAFHNVSKTIERIVHRIHSGTECGAGAGYFSVDAKGNISACHREGLTAIGKLFDGGIDESLRAKWLDNRIYCREGCMECPLRYICGGGCREESLAENNDIRKPLSASCRLKFIFFKAAAWIISELGEERCQKIIPVPSNIKNARKVLSPDQQRDRVVDLTCSSGERRR